MGKRRRLVWDEDFKGSESALCDRLVTVAREEGFRVVPECSDWDMILVAPETGEQIGVQAKLRANLEVLSQAIVSKNSHGPDIATVLVPKATHEFWRVAHAMGIGVFTYGMLADVPPREREWRREREGPLWMLGKGPRRDVTKGRCWVPDEGVDIVIPCGVPSPKRISPWKIGAAKICIRLRAGELLTSKDFASHGITPGMWVQRGYIKAVGKVGRLTQYALAGPGNGGRFDLPDVGMPEVMIAVQASLDAAKANE